MTIYCECGSCNQYSGARPKFCQSCGTTFDKSAASLAKAAKPRERYREIEEEEEIDVSLAFDIKTEGTAPEKLTIGSLQRQPGFSFERPQADEKSSAAKQEALKHMLKQS